MIAKVMNNLKSDGYKKELVVEILFFLLGLILGLLILMMTVWILSKEVILPGVAVGGVRLSGKDIYQARQILKEKTESYTPRIILGQSEIKVPRDVLAFDYDASIVQAQQLGRTFNLQNIISLLFGKIDLPLIVSINRDEFAKWSDQLAASVNVPGKPAILITKMGILSVQNGIDGVKLDTETLKNHLETVASNLSEEKWEVPIKNEEMRLSAEQEKIINEKLTLLVQKSLIIKIDVNRVELTGKELPSFVDLTPATAGQISEQNLKTFVEGLASRYDREPQDAKFEFAQGRVKEFAPGLDGLLINEEATVLMIKDGIERLINNETVTEVTAVIRKISPKITTAEVNNLGITELIGRGESYYAHSIPNRIFNVGLASSRINGVLVPPGEEFSFNHEVGEISAATGYKTAYVIQNGRTELGDGGGVCQVSTTLFRAAMNAGLPITERWAHAYRVGYYEQNNKPGVDATVFSPSKDFRFKNDTGNYLLIQAINDPKNLHLIFEIYGTSDGRVATVSTPVVSGVTPPPPDLYQDDPTLPTGTIKQVDWSAWGAKASFDYKVEKNGEVIFAQTFVSNYKPWANVYLKGTGN